VLAEWDTRTFQRTYHRNFRDAISHSCISVASNRPSWEGVSPPSPEVGEELLRNVVYLKVFTYFNQVRMKSSWTPILITIDLQWILVIRFFHNNKRFDMYLYSFSRTLSRYSELQPATKFLSLSVCYKILWRFILESQGNNKLAITESITTDFWSYVTLHDLL
jgi:hypothetical protein